jgi:hypothetical protein
MNEVIICKNSMCVVVFVELGCSGPGYRPRFYAIFSNRLSCRHDSSRGVFLDYVNTE